MAAEIKKISNYLCVPTGNVTEDKKHQAITLHDQNGCRVNGLVSIVKYLSRKSKIKDVLGRSAEDHALVDQWLEYRVTQVDRALQEKNLHFILEELNSHLSDRVYLVGFYCTVADVLLYLGLYTTMSEMSFYEKQKYLHLSRWFDQIQHQSDIMENSQKVYFQRNLIYSLHSSH